MMPDLLGGVVDIAFDGMGTSAPQIKAGKLRPLAVSSATRNAAASRTCPTMAEAGVDGLRGDDLVRDLGDQGHAEGHPATRCTPRSRRRCRIPDIKKIWDQQGADRRRHAARRSSARFVRSEIENWGKVVKDSGAKIDN